ncbi:hypothetical protein UFOVP457_64 [uncultured Caudovirales phage]|uniref:Uncharacterized protein n=1 Tax=uncultured Caudovirales phage TaxID=2100421 RepID=A0A6J5MDQ1_9CAUD|nr:hypothetical protein UFOVP457_64 [uncultured Caudovirales phage]
MIELNCTYEESKKILELGYDFSPLCPFYRVVKGKSISIFNGIEFILNRGLIDRLESELLVELDREEIHPNLGKSYRKSLVEKNIFDEIIPIIPKAALEACLPLELPILNENIDESWKLYLLKNLYGAGTISYQKILSLPADEIYKIHRADWDKLIVSAFEAFTWCHENYPEELRKKFDEVMG